MDITAITNEGVGTEPVFTSRRALIEQPQQQAGYNAGAHPDTSSELDLGDWPTIPQSADADILPSQEIASARAIDLTQNNGFAEGSRQFYVNHIVGPNGLKLTSQPNYAAIGATEKWSREFGSELEAAWRSVTRLDSTKLDADDTMNWLMMQSQAVNSLVHHGEILATYQPVPGAHDLITKVRLIDPSRLSDPLDTANAGTLRNRDIRKGIEYDSQGRPVAYWIASRHPVEYRARGLTGRDKVTWKRVPKYSRSGRRVVFHVFDPLRVAQSRGMPVLATVLKAAKMLDKVSDVTLQAALLQVVFAAVVKSNASWTEIMEVIGAENLDAGSGGGMKVMKNFMQARADFYSRNRINVKGAKTVHLLPEEELQLTEAKTANPDIAKFIDEMSREVARGQGMTKEQYSGDYSATNFSSARMSNIETNKGMTGRRNRCIAPFCQWVYTFFVEEFCIRFPNLLPRDVTFKDAAGALTSAQWAGPPMVDADPEKSAKAAQRRLEMGVSSLDHECAQMGLDWEDVLRQRAKESALAKELGLPDPHAVKTASGVIAGVTGVDVDGGDDDEADNGNGKAGQGDE